MTSHRKAFTLIELLVVIAIIAILAVVVVLTLNPAQLLSQSRDANRISDMATLNSAIALYSTDQSGASAYSLGTASTSYLSLPASATNCSSLGLATSAYSYACANSTNYRLASSSGWLPVNFQNISSGSPFGSVPVDPVNQTSSNLYYSYETNGNQYALSAFMESAKYAKNMQSTGGIDPALYEIGSGISILPNASRGLMGYWNFDEGSGSVAHDQSGNSETGTLSGSGTSTPAWAGGKIGSGALMFDGNYAYVSIPNNIINLTSDFTVSLWTNSTNFNGPSAYQRIVTLQGSDGSQIDLAFLTSGALTYRASAGINQVTANVYQTGTWYQITLVRSSGSYFIYVNGVGQALGSGGITANGTNSRIGGYNGTSAGNFAGTLDDVRIYDRALSSAEVQQIYNAEK